MGRLNRRGKPWDFGSEPPKLGTVAGVARLDQALADALEQTAAVAATQSGPTVSAHLLERAAGLTAESRERRVLLVRAAEGFISGGELEQASLLLDEADRCDAVHADDSASIARARGRLERTRGNLEAANELLCAAAERIRDVAPDQASVLLLEAAISIIGVAPRRGLQPALAAAQLDPQALMPRLVAGSLRLFLGERDAPSIVEIETGIATLLESDDLPATIEHLVYGPLCALKEIGERERALRVHNELVARLSAMRADGVIPIVLSVRGALNFELGHWDAALRDFRETVFRCDAANLLSEAAASLPWLARLEAGMGHETECHEHLSRAHTALGRLGLDWSQYLIAHARLLELTLERPEKAYRLSIHPRERRSACDWIEAAIRLGHRQEAVAALADLERRSANDYSLVPPVFRCKALLATDDELELSFGRAIEAETALPTMVFETARTKLLFGERLRRADRRVRAREPLEAALDVFERLPAKPWADRARRELMATASRARMNHPGGLVELTSQELAVARAVAAGATNREVAAALYLSLKTVEFHLRNAYRKLDVRSRSELTRIVSRATAV
jgi:DNA-binding CsgD family transcriptional regulator